MCMCAWRPVVHNGYFSCPFYLLRQDLPLNLEQANSVSLASQFAPWVRTISLSLSACLPGFYASSRLKSTLTFNRKSFIHLVLSPVLRHCLSNQHSPKKFLKNKSSISAKIYKSMNLSSKDYEALPSPHMSGAAGPLRNIASLSCRCLWAQCSWCI